MKAPRDRNSPINQARKDDWLHDFQGYRSAVNQGRLDAYLEQFANADQDLAARVLDCVEFYGGDRIAHAFRTGLASLAGWHVDPAQRVGQWRFASLSPSAGDSGGTMLYQFRLANKLSGKPFHSLFVHPSELLGQGLGADDTVVLLDDIIGTGQQASDAWKSAFSELVAGVGTVYLMVVAACRHGRERVEQETGLTVHSAHNFDAADNVFADECLHFTAEEKKTFKKYCKRGSKKAPAGYGDCGLLVVFAHQCPNGSVAALHSANNKWRGLFPRHG